MQEQPKVSMATVGINQDSDPLSLKEGEYTYMLNGTVSNRGGYDPFAGNMEGSVDVTRLPAGYMYLGHCLLNQNDSVVMSCTLSGDSEIGILKNDTYTTVVNYTGLKFNIRYPIQVKFKLNYRNERIIYWTNNDQPPYWMNLDKPNYQKTLDVDGCTLIDSTSLDLDFMKIFKNYTRPCIIVADVLENGRLQSGGYFITAQYADVNSNGLTAWFPLIGPIPIYKDSISQSKESITGIESEIITGKSILIKISGADLSFSHINLGVIRVTNGIRRPFRIATIGIGRTEYLYTGAGTVEEPVELSDIVRPAVNYDTAKTIETTLSKLMLGNMKSSKDFNFQPYASKIQVNWQVYKAWSDDTINSFKNPLFSAYMRVFRQDEIYALALVLDMVDGTQSDAWHIPGRRKNRRADGSLFASSQQLVYTRSASFQSLGNRLLVDGPDMGIRPGTVFTISGSANNNRTLRVWATAFYNNVTYIEFTNETLISEGPVNITLTMADQLPDAFGNMIPVEHWDDAQTQAGADIHELTPVVRYNVYNTAYQTGSTSTGTLTGLSEYGEMGYHESIEKYGCDKNIWGDDANQPIRHHHMPDSTIFHIHDGLDGGRKFEDRVMLNYLGVSLPNVEEVIASLPSDFKGKVKGWRLVVGDRTYNKTVIASGILLNARKSNWKYGTDSKDDFRLYPNYPLNDLRTDPYASETVAGILPTGGPITGRVIPKNALVYLQDSFFFHSPDTHFKKSYLANGELKINVELYGKTESHYEFVDPYPEFAENKNDNDRAALEAISIARYNNYKKPLQHQTRRKLKDAFYVPFNSKVGGGTGNLPIYNKSRESSVFLSTTRTIADPTVRDTSRFVLSDRDAHDITTDEKFTCLIRPRTRSASILYGTIKNPLPNQYGTIHDIRYNDSYPCKPGDIPANIVFAGDTFLGAFSLKTQMPFYQNVETYQSWGDGLNKADFLSAATLPYTYYYYRNRTGNPRKKSTMMCEDNSGHGVWGIGGDGDATALGYLTLMMYGIPYFWAESDVNLELRGVGISAEQTFWPNLNNGTFKLNEFLSVATLKHDNKFIINEDYSAKNNIKLIEPITPFYDPLDKDKTHYNTRVIWSLDSQPEDINDNWLRFQPLNYYDLSKTKGELVDIRYLGNFRTAFRTTGSLFMDRLYTDLATSDGAVSLGSGKMFQKPPEEVVTSDDKYVGSSAQLAFNSTPLGSMFPSPDTGKVFLLSDQVHDITEGVSDWFQNNLPFVLSKQIKVLSEDNAINPEGIGLVSDWDPVQKLWYLTKKDYSVINPLNISQLHYQDGRLKLNEVFVSLKDRTLFEDKSWTFAYSPSNRHWISWQSFLPSFYILQDLAIYSGDNGNDTAFRKHNIEGIYCSYGGKKYPWIVEGVDKVDGINSYVNPSISFTSRIAKRMDESEMITFNKAQVYNMYQHSGMLNLIIQDENDLSQLFKQLLTTDSSQDVALRIREGHFNFSDFYDLFRGGNKHFFTNDWGNPDYQAQYPIDKVLDHSTINYDKQYNDVALLRERWNKYRLILDNRNDLKLLLQFVLVSNRQTVS